MSEVQFRPSGSRGRGSARGGRGGYSSRGGRSNKPAKADSENMSEPSYEDEGEIGQLKKKHAGNLSTIKELFADWTDEDLVFALEDADGDLEIAIERITEGNVSQWGEVKKKHTDRSRVKAKEPLSQAESTSAPPNRGGRGRGGFETRGRARGDRGRGGRGGRAGGHVNGTRAEKPGVHAIEESEAAAAVPADTWEKSEEPAVADVAASTEPGTTAVANELQEQATQKSSLIPEGSKKGWASLFSQPAPPPPQKKAPPPATATAPKPTEPPLQKPSEQPSEEPEVVRQATVPRAVEPLTSTPLQTTHVPVIPKDELTQTNLERVPDVSHPQTSTTAASTVATSTPEQPSGTGATASQTRHISGYTATAYKATTGSGRAANLQRRVMEQQEAVVMPGNHAVDRAAVQFGSMGLNGPVDLDIDEEREKPETRAQPPQHSPVAPRASLPPSTQAQTQAQPPDTVALPRPAPGLPPAPSASSTDAPFNDFGRYTEAQKPYDPFSQQADQSQPQTQEPFSNQAPIPSQATATTAADYSAIYGGDQARNPYYYGSYGQSQDGVSTQQRAGSGFNVSGADVQPQVASTQPPSRFTHVEAPSSGQNTPNPTLPGQTTQPAQHVPQAQGAHGAYNYAYPYYSNPHYANTYMSQMNQHQYGRNRPMYDDARRYEEHYLHNNQFGYGNQYAAPYGAKGGMYAQPQHGFSYDHASSPATAASFNQNVPGREAGYGRTGSAQPSDAQTSGHTAFGGIPDVFGRTQSGFVQSQPIAQQQPVSAEETAKGFEAPKAGGPSPSLAQANRPGSATNSGPGQPQAGQTSLPPAQGQPTSQQGFGAYPQLNPQYSGLGSLGAHHQGANASHHQASGYGNYGAGFSGNYYGNSGRGGGWGGNYGH
ncbi:rnapii degradation factor def1 [Histoplasma capsulatum var. duboisii H88]|uniref:RNA polymerase II degradation factor 1 n=2 Tax=Ajellomyces capsulatus TaxID=5037 RepID=F0U7Z5_AJEC8|nr:rnapii degradation factor def1 [Histoplasma capsulatum H143]EGC40817.1 rnapii degradation factor def1 [Histoplasma capsulatum var. duboisii H88]QSS52740.1 rnapii degradation factor def1 [Histoplasma capsulatum var. duboisii H88]